MGVASPLSSLMWCLAEVWDCACHVIVKVSVLAGGPADVWPVSLSSRQLLNTPSGIQLVSNRLVLQLRAYRQSNVQCLVHSKTQRRRSLLWLFIMLTKGTARWASVDSLSSRI